VKVFGRPARELGLHAGVTGVGKPPREETARRLGWVVVQGAYGDLSVTRRRI
jgi:hypothetical protein